MKFEIEIPKMQKDEFYEDVIFYKKVDFQKNNIKIP